MVQRLNLGWASAILLIENGRDCLNSIKNYWRGQDTNAFRKQIIYYFGKKKTADIKCQKVREEECAFLPRKGEKQKMDQNIKQRLRSGSIKKSTLRSWDFLFWKRAITYCFQEDYTNRSFYFTVTSVELWWYIICTHESKGNYTRPISREQPFVKETNLPL